MKSKLAYTLLMVSLMGSLAACGNKNQSQITDKTTAAGTDMTVAATSDQSESEYEPEDGELEGFDDADTEESAPVSAVPNSDGKLFVQNEHAFTKYGNMTLNPKDTFNFGNYSDKEYITYVVYDADTDTKLMTYMATPYEPFCVQCDHFLALGDKTYNLRIEQYAMQLAANGTLTSVSDTTPCSKQFVTLTLDSNAKITNEFEAPNALCWSDGTKDIGGKSYIKIKENINSPYNTMNAINYVQNDTDKTIKVNVMAVLDDHHTLEEQMEHTVHTDVVVEPGEKAVVKVGTGNVNGNSKIRFIQQIDDGSLVGQDISFKQGAYVSRFNQFF